MTAPTIPRVTLPKTADELRPVPLGHWLAAGTPVSEPYPCTCRYSPCSYDKCADRMRTEGDALPDGCCGRRAPSRVAEGFQGGRPADWRTPSEGRGGSGVSVGPQEARKSLHGDPGAPRGASSCDCPTPWQAPPPVLLIAAGKDGPVRTRLDLGRIQHDARAAADGALIAAGLERISPWKDGRHVLLPPQPGARGKSRPCWSAKLADKRLAVLDTPEETGSGVHCPDCHLDFGNAGAYQLHRQRLAGGRERCKDPRAVTVVEYAEVIPAVVDLVGRVRQASRTGQVVRGAPMLVRGMAGVWQTDAKSPWGRQGPPMTPEEASGVWQRGQERLAAERRWACRARHATWWECRRARCRYSQP